MDFILFSLSFVSIASFVWAPGGPSVISPSSDGRTVVSIPENTARGEVIFTVLPKSNSWRYQFESPTYPYFDIDGTGKVKLSYQLDYERGPPSHSFVLTIRITESSRSILRILTVYVTNVFDEAPNIVITPKSVTIDEELAPHTALPIHVAVQDEDTDDRHTFSLYGQGSTYLKIHPKLGTITVNSRLDYDSGVTLLKPYVMVTDKGGNSASATFTVTITNINDNKPTCSPTTIQTTAEENVKREVTKLQCTDQDASSTSLFYKIVAGDDFTKSFGMTGQTLNIIRALDYERTPRYALTIHVTDSSAGIINTATVTVNVQVVDKNEEPPQWPVSSQTLEIEENFPVGKTIFTCVASDPDGQPGQKLTYSIVGSVPPSTFHVNAVTGELSSIRNLDYETGPRSYTIRVQATDGGSPPRSSTSDLTLTLNIKDVNDNPPVFTQNQYTFRIAENLPPSKTIGSVSATDSDGTNNDVSYVFSSTSTSDFKVDKSGIISTTTSLDRESVSVYILVVKAVDEGHPSLTATATVTVNVDDVNDCPPEFDSTFYAGSVSENAIASNIVSMTITDRDVTSGTLNVNIENKSSISGKLLNSLFKIDKNVNFYSISLKRAVDRETDQTFIFKIYAVDTLTPPMTSTATVRIDVIDVNEPPLWVTSRSKDFAVPEDIKVGQVVFTVSATDDDSMSGGHIHYSLDSASNAFQLDSATGEIRTKTSFDYDRGTRLFTLTIRATDGGIPPLSATPNIVLTIHITDVNDNAPVFTQSSYTFYIDENKAPSSFVGTVSATDQDSSLHSILSYEIDTPVLGNHLPFTISTGTKLIYTTMALDRETQAMYVMKVKVSDSGVTRFTGTATVTIFVRDVNDNSPEFDKTSYSGVVREDAISGTSILLMKVKDKDDGRNGKVILSVIPNSQAAGLAFEADSSTGILSLRVSNLLDRETRSTYTFEVKAIDSAVSPLTSTAVVTITVLDANDNAPNMDPLFYNTEIDYTGVCGNEIVTVSGHDDDVGNNSRLSFFIITSTFDYLFSLNPSSGVFSLKSYLSKDFRYVIEASVKDGGNPVMAASKPATIRVDSFSLTGPAVTFSLKVDKNAFEANQATFVSRIEAFINLSYRGAILKICCVDVKSGSALVPTTSRRKLLGTSSPIDVHVYVIANNVTDDPANINVTKRFLTSTQLLGVLSTDPRGGPVSQLKTGRMEYFHVVKVTPYHMTVTPWPETVEGIIIITFSVILAVIFIVILIVVICYTCKRRKRPVIPTRLDKRPRLEFAYKTPRTRPLKKMEVPDLAEIKKRPPPVVTSLPYPAFSLKPLPMKSGDDGVSSIGSQLKDEGGSVVVNRHFDGTAIDEATGRVFRYNTRMNEREWLTTPEGRSVTVTHH